MVVGRVLISFLHKSSNNEMLTWANQWHLMAINNKSRLAIQQSQTAIAIVCH